jgi:hypothetical protein
MRYELLFPSKYFKGADFFDGPKTFTIKAIVQDEVKTQRGTERKGLLYFEEVPDKSLILNVTNARAIANMYGPEMNEWTGKQVTLCMTQASCEGGEMKDCVRIMKGNPVAAAKGAKK